MPLRTLRPDWRSFHSVPSANNFLTILNLLRLASSSSPKHHRNLQYFTEACPGPSTALQYKRDRQSAAAHPPTALVQASTTPSTHHIKSLHIIPSQAATMSDGFVAPSIEHPSNGSAPSGLENVKNNAITSEVSFNCCVNLSVLSAYS